MPPLYKVTQGQDGDTTSTTDDELQTLLHEIGRDPKPEIQRYKGLGEMSQRAAVGDHHEPRNPHHDAGVTLKDAMAADEIFTPPDGRPGGAPARSSSRKTAKLVTDLDI